MTRGSIIWSLSPDAQRQIREQIKAQEAAKERGPIPTPTHLEYQNKFGARKTQYRSVQGFEYICDSALEARHAAGLDMGITAKTVRFWIPQVPFLLPGGVRYKVDFFVLWAAGNFSFQDCKGRDTPQSILKRKQVFACYGVSVEIVRKA